LKIQYYRVVLCAVEVTSFESSSGIQTTSSWKMTRSLRARRWAISMSRDGSKDPKTCNAPTYTTGIQSVSAYSLSIGRPPAAWDIIVPRRSSMENLSPYRATVYDLLMDNKLNQSIMTTPRVDGKPQLPPTATSLNDFSSHYIGLFFIAQN